MHRTLAATLFLACLPTRIHGAGDGTFHAPLRLAANSPIGLTSGDFDGDGDPDLASMSYDSRVTVHLNDASAPVGWRHEPSFGFGTGSIFIRAADFDGDGKADLAAGDTAQGILVATSKGGGKFGVPRLLKGPPAARWVAFADLDGDGRLDLAATDIGSAAIVTYKGGGDGSFAPSGSYPTLLGTPHSVEMLDHDGDGDLDLQAGVLGAGLLLFWGDASGAFTRGPSTTELGIDFGVRYQSLGDLDGDRKTDVATSEGVVGLSLGDGHYNRIGAATFEPGSIICPAVADYDGDALLDVAFAAAEGVQAFAGDGHGGLGKAQTHPAKSRNAFFWATPDLDLDGLADLVVADVDGGSLATFHGSRGPRLFESGALLKWPGPARGLAAADVTGDGALDLLLSNVIEPRVYLYESPGASPGEVFAKSIATSGPFESLEAVDLDGDGLIDFAGTSERGGVFRTALLDAAHAVSSEAVYAAGKAPQLAVLGALDGDAFIDAVVPCAGANHLAVLRGLQGGAFEAARIVPTVVRPVATALGDLDGDGDLDALVGGSGMLAVHLGAGDGTLGEPRDLATRAGGSFRSAIAADMNGDGRLDVVATEKVLKYALVRLAQPGGAFAPTFQSPLGIAATDARAAELNADGRMDIVASSADDGAIAALHGRGDGSFDAPIQYVAGSSGLKVRLLDVDGDGAADVFTTSDRAALVLFGNAAPSTPAFLRGDADGDGGSGITDAVVLLAALFQGGTQVDCLDSADADDDGAVSLTDAIYLLRWLFQGGPEPPAPGLLECGADPTEDNLAPCAGQCSGKAAATP